MAAHRPDVSVLFGVPAEAFDLLDGRGRQECESDVAVSDQTLAATWQVPDVIGLRLPVALARLGDRGIPTRVRVTSTAGPVGIVTWQRPRSGSIVTTDDVFTLGVSAGTPVRVPDVVLASEEQARAAIQAAGLEPGQRSPAPRPASRRSEVVMRTHPRAGSIALAGSRVDYELLPGEPCVRPQPRDYVDYDAASCVSAAGALAAPADADSDEPPYVDYDVIDTLFRFGHRPVEGRA